jgi:cytoskeletal protein RodZ
MKELSEFLKTERLNRNLTLEAVSRRSGISINMLICVESCNFQPFGASLIIRNTIRAYCKILGIDAEPLIKKFSSEIEAYNIQDTGIKRYGRQMRFLHKKRRMIGLPLFILFVISAGAFYGGAWLSERRSKLSAPLDADRIFTQEELPAELQQQTSRGPDSRVDKPGSVLRKADEAIRNADILIKESEMTAGKSRKIDHSEDQTKNSIEQSGEPQEVNVTPDTDVPAPPAFSNSTDAVADDGPDQYLKEPSRNRFAVEADDKVWIQVRIDDRKTLSEMLHAGDRREWPADKSLQVVIGNAGGIRMKWNEQPLKAPRDPGRVLRFRLPDYAIAE